MKNKTLPKEFDFYDNFLTEKESNLLFEKIILEIEFEQHSITLFNKKIPEPRLIASFGTKSYTYSKKKLNPKPIPKFILPLKSKLETFIGVKFNFILINLYRNGQDSMGAHSDDEKELGDNPIIASISLGDERNFIIKSKDKKEKYNISLNNGSLLVMKKESQRLYTHELPKTKKIKDKRINLTFRYIK